MATSKAFNIKILLALQDKISKQLDKPQKRVKNFGAAVAGSIGAGLILATKSAIEFESGMRNANTMMKLSEAEFKKVKTEALDLATRVPVAMEDIPTAMFNIASAGLDASKSMEAIAMAAVAGNTPLDQMVELGAAVVNSFQDIKEEDLPAVFDATQAAMERGVLTMDDMVVNFGKVIPQAKKMGENFETALGAFTFATTQGLSAAEAATSVAAAYRDLSTRSVELAQAGIEVFDAHGKFRGIQPIMADLKAEVAGMTDAERDAKLAMLNFTDESAKAIVAFMSDVDKLGQTIEAVEASSGSVMRAFGEQMKDPSKALILLKNNVLALMAEFGEPFAQVVATAANKIADLVEWIRGWGDTTKKVVSTIALVVGAIGGWVAVGGTLLPIITGMGTVIMSTVVPALGFLISPIGLVVAAIGGLIFAFVKWREEIGAGFKIALGFVVKKFGDFLSMVAKIVSRTTGIPGIGDKMKGLEKSLRAGAKAAEDWGDDSMKAGKSAWEALKEVKDQAVAAKKEQAKLNDEMERTQRAVDGLNKRLRGTAEEMDNLGVRTVETMATTVEAVEGLDESVRDLDEHSHSWVIGMEDDLNRFLGGVGQGLKDYYVDVLDGAKIFGGDFTDLWRDIEDAAKDALAEMLKVKTIEILSAGLQVALIWLDDQWKKIGDNAERAKNEMIKAKALSLIPGGGGGAGGGGAGGGGAAAAGVAKIAGSLGSLGSGFASLAPPFALAAAGAFAVKGIIERSRAPTLHDTILRSSSRYSAEDVKWAEQMRALTGQLNEFMKTTNVGGVQQTLTAEQLAQRGNLERQIQELGGPPNYQIIINGGSTLTEDGLQELGRTVQEALDANNASRAA